MLRSLGGFDTCHIHVICTECYDKVPGAALVVLELTALKKTVLLGYETLCIFFKRFIQGTVDFEDG